MKANNEMLIAAMHKAEEEGLINFTSEDGIDQFGKLENIINAALSKIPESLIVEYLQDKLPNYFPTENK